MERTFKEDLEAVAKIAVVKSILEVICRTTGMGFSAVARVTGERWIACAVRDEISFGLVPGGELKVETTICHEIRASGEAVVVDHVSEDEVFCGHLTPKMYGFQSYISVPIKLVSGEFFGTLCAIDPRPARLNRPEIVGMFKLFADLIAQHLESQRRLAVSEAALLDERETAVLREQFVAVLGHDLRNPLGAIDSGTQLLRMMPLGEDAEDVLGIIQRSVGRMTGLINSVLDFARGRLGGGLGVRCVEERELGKVLEQVVAELQAIRPLQRVYCEMDLRGVVYCDGARIGQMLSNLLGNALTHGDAESPVWVRARNSGEGFELSVTNRGATIPPDVIERLFQPFTRGSDRMGQQGLGLGLYIATEIAKAHRGELTVTSSERETCFVFRMPM